MKKLLFISLFFSFISAVQARASDVYICPCYVDVTTIERSWWIFSEGEKVVSQEKIGEFEFALFDKPNKLNARSLSETKNWVGEQCRFKFRNEDAYTILYYCEEKSTPPGNYECTYDYRQTRAVYTDKYDCKLLSE